MRPRLLDLFCGAGGAAMGYHLAGFNVIGVDINPQPNYPFEFRRADAIEYAAQRGRWFAAIHASPPCQHYSVLAHRNGNGHEHPDLIDKTREILEDTGRPYVIENVMGAKKHLREPIMLQGSNFGLHVQKKRLFETNWPLDQPVFQIETSREFLVYEHKRWRWTKNVPVYGRGGRKAVEYWPMAMGVGDTWDDCWMTRDELAEAIPPAYTKYIGVRLLDHLGFGAARRNAV